jgi:hypothetical protein
MLHFYCEHAEPYSTVEMTLSEDSALPEVLEAFEDFLRGCGYSFSGHLDLIDSDE